MLEADAAEQFVVMKQADLALNLTTKRTRRWEFPVETMLRIHFMQRWFTLTDPAMEDALPDVPLFRDFAGLNWRA